MKDILASECFRDVGAAAFTTSNPYVGLDPSFSGYGVCVVFDGRIHVREYATPPGEMRFVRLHAFLSRVLTGLRAPSVAIEGYASGSFGQGKGGANLLYAGEIGGISRLCLQQCGIGYMEVPPNVLKKYVTGKGNAKKSLVMLQLYKNFGIETKTDNEADAVGLALYRASLSGVSSHGSQEIEAGPARPVRKRTGKSAGARDATVSGG